MSAYQRFIAAFHLLFATVILLGLANAETFSGSVVDPNGKPVKATIYVVGLRGWKVEDKTVQSGADGLFQIETQPPTTFDPANTPKSQNAQQVSVAVYAPGLSIGIATLKSGAVNLIPLENPRKISGVVKNDKGAVVVGATVQISLLFPPRTEEQDFFAFQPTGDMLQQLTGKTGANGTWEISGIPTGVGGQLSLVDPQYVPATIQIDDDGEAIGPRDSRNLVARLAGTISGRMLGVAGKPVAGTSMWATPMGDQSRSSNAAGITAVNGDGTFQFTRLAPGTYCVLVRNPSAQRRYFVGDTPAKTLPVTVAAAVDNVVVQAGKNVSLPPFQAVQFGTVKGRVFNRATGKPVAGIAVGAYGKTSPRSAGVLPWAWTDKDGRYELPLYPGANAIYAWEDNYMGRQKTPIISPVATTLAAGENKTLSLYIDRTVAEIEGRTIDEKGTPVPNVTITAWGDAGLGQSLISDADGHFKMDHAPLGSLRLDPRNEFTVIRPQKLVATSGENKPVDIVVRKNQLASLQGRTVDTAGLPVAGVKIRIQVPALIDGHNGYYLLNATSDKDGQFVFKKVNMPNALKLKVDSAVKTGFKLQTKSSVPEAAKAESSTVDLTDMVMEKLGNALKGQVIGSDGNAVAGAVVVSSGDNYESQVTTDAAGNFVLTGQPEGFLQVMAAFNRDFGQATSDKNGVKITLQSGAANPGRDIAGANTLFQEMITAGGLKSVGEAARALAPYDVAAALELLKKDPKISPDAAIMVIISALDSRSSDASLEWAKSHVTEIQATNDFVRFSAQLGELLAENHPNEAKVIFDEALRRSRLDTGLQLSSTAYLAALAARLKLPQASEILTQVLAKARQNGTEPSSLVAALSTGSAELAGQVLEILPESKEANISSYRNAIHEVAKYDVNGAQQLLGEMRLLVDAVPELADRDGQLQGRASMEFEWAFAAKDVIQQLPPSDAEGAAAIARQVQQWHRVPAFALAAEHGTKEQKLAIVDEAVQAETRGDWMKNITVPRLAALAAPLDNAKAAALFAETAASLAKLRQESPDSVSADWGFYAGFWDSAQARLYLESEWQRVQTRADDPNDKMNSSEWNQESLAKAMGSVDLDRALEWARQLPTKPRALQSSALAETLEFLGEFLLRNPSERRMMVIGSETGFDS